MNYEALIGHSLQDTAKIKETLKSLLGVKRLGGNRMKMILDEGVREDAFRIEDGKIVSASKRYSVDSFYEEIYEGIYALPVKNLQPKELIITEKNIGDLPQVGDMYHYLHYNNKVVQGEVLGVYCFCEVRVPNENTFQSVSLSDMKIKKKDVVKEPRSMSAFYKDNMALKAERDRLLKELELLNAQIEIKKKENKNDFSFSNSFIALEK